MAGIEITSSADGWAAARGHEPAGSLRAVVTPDDRRFVFFADCHDDAYGPLVAAAAGQLDGELHTMVDEADGPALRRAAELGFTVARHEHHYLVPTDPARHRLLDATPPPGFDLVSAADADLGLLRALDEAVRADIPGSDGWRWRRLADFRDETFGFGFDPATYLVAVERRTGAHVGLVRVWMNPECPRLGCVGVLPALRRTRITRALLGTVAHVLHERGHPAVTAEIATTNRASLALVARSGATRTGGTYVLVRPPDR